MIELAGIRRVAGVTQAEMAARLQMTQSSVSQLERRTDFLLSTLQDYLNALGAEAHIRVAIGGTTIEYDLTGDR